MTIQFESREEAHDTLHALLALMEMAAEHQGFGDRMTAADTYHAFRLIDGAEQYLADDSHMEE